MERKKRIAFLEVLRDFSGTEKRSEEANIENSDKQLESYMQEKGFDDEYKKAQKALKDLERMLEHPDVKSKGEKRKKPQSTITSKKTEQYMFNNNQRTYKEDKEIER